jgi:squalene synthase HpnC
MPINHYENFPVASVLLPAHLRIPVALIYRFARAADDFADEGSLPDHERLARLAAFGDELRALERGAPASSEQGPAERGAGTRLRDATVQPAVGASVIPAPCASPGSDPKGNPLPPCDAPRLRDANVRESGAAPSSAGVASVSGVTSPKGTPVPPSDGASSRAALFQQLAPVIGKHRLPFDLFHDLLSAFAQDVTKKRYADFAAVLDYSRRSANPVGRLLLALYDAATPRNLAWSDNICSGLQIINFLQDIAIDYARGRIYMPQDELARYRVSETQIAAHDTGGAWREFMTFQVDRARRMLWDGAPLGRMLPGRIGLEMRMIIAGGDRILTKILNANGDVFRRRPVLRSHDWMLMFARTFSMH